MERIKAFLRIVEFVVGEAFASMARSAWMSWLVVATTTVSLSILGGFWMLSQDLGSVAAAFGAKVPIVAFVKDSANADSLKGAIASLPGVKAVVVIPKEKAWRDMQSDMRTKMTFDNLLVDNPLPDALRIETTSPEATAEVAKRVAGLDGVEEISYGRDLLVKIKDFATITRTAGLALSGLLALAALAVIMNTIRLAVMARKREIEIMHLVGASNAFIAWPFLLEGLFFGLFAGLLTSGLLVGWRSLTLTKWKEFFPFVHLGIDWTSWLTVSLGVALLGMGLGALGSALSVRRHIKLAS